MTTIYGLKNCDTCRKARKLLEASGASVTFVDVRETPLGRSDMDRFLATFGVALLNRKSTTWRGLTEDERNAPTVELLALHPALMKRPLIEGPGGVTLGWDAAAESAHLG